MPATRGQAPRRAALRSQIHTYFTGAAEQVAVGCDVLKGQALRRLPALAMDFDSELLLLGDAAWPRWQCGRLAMEAPCSVWLVPPESAPVLRRVLVPIDFSERSAHCLRAALELARPFPRSKCLALHVYRHDTRFADLAFDQLCRHTLADRFARFVAGIDTHGVALEPIFAESHRVDQEIARAAQRQGADLIVMTSRGRTRAARIALPSVTEGTLCQSRAACLVLKSADSPIGLWQALRERWHRADGIHFS
jgi:nucleotide-binding universal stress UspA family protein